MTDPTIQPMPPADDVFARARADAVAHHVKALRDAILALRGLGEHALAEQLLADELGDTIQERRSIDARRAQRLRARLRLLSPAPASSATEIN